MKVAQMAYLGLLLAAAATVADDAKPFALVGYLPSYRMAGFDPSTAKMLTHVVYFSLSPQEDGSLDLQRLQPQHLQTLRKLKSEHHVRLSICVGGWGKSKGFTKLAAGEESRARFAKEIAAFCRTEQFDGADLDWEHPADHEQEADYGRLLKAVAKEFAQDHFELTIAAAGWQKLTAEAIAAVDRVHLMAYDGPGRHSTFEMAKKDVERMAKQGVPSAKICLGVPFYGRGVSDRKKSPTYAQLAASNSLSPETDEVGGVYFNGVRTIEAKTIFAREQKLGGMMIGRSARTPRATGRCSRRCTGRRRSDCCDRAIDGSFFGAMPKGLRGHVHGSVGSVHASHARAKPWAWHQSCDPSNARGATTRHATPGTAHRASRLRRRRLP